MSNAEKLDRRVATAFFGGFKDLKDNQEATIIPLLDGNNVVLTSGTGSGKTEAVMAPLVSKYWREAVVNDSLFLLYIAPTKALVNDLYKRLFPPINALHLRIGIRHGDRDDLYSGQMPHILITTPESLDVMLFRKDKALSNIKTVVVDEVHLLYNTQRGLHLSILLRRLNHLIDSKFQWAALSATVGSLEFIRDFLMGNNEQAVFINFPSNREIDSFITYINDQAAFIELIKKLISGRATKLLVFTNSRRECEILSGALQEIELLNNSVFAHYSSLSIEVRLEVEKQFSNLKTAICVATSTLELGIDIGDIDAVLLWGMPGGIDAFLQRIGRSNRRSKKTNVICLIPDSSEKTCLDALHFMALANAASKGELPVQEPFELYGAVGQQCLSLIASNEGRFMRLSDLHEMFEQNAHITKEITEGILNELAYNGYLQKHGYKNRYGADEKLYELVDLKLIYGNFGWGTQKVELYYGKQLLGEVPAINLIRINNHDSVRFSGKNWRVTKANYTGIFLEPVKSSTNAKDFTYGGNKISTEPEIINRIWLTIHKDSLPAQNLSNNLAKEVCLFAKKVKSICTINSIPYVNNPGSITYYTFAGDIVNRAICLFTKQLEFETNDYSIKVLNPINWSSIPICPLEYNNCFDMLFEETPRQSIYQKQLPIELQKHEYLQSWVKDKNIHKILKRLSRSSLIEINSYSNPFVEP